MTIDQLTALIQTATAQTAHPANQLVRVRHKESSICCGVVTHQYTARRYDGSFWSLSLEASLGTVLQGHSVKVSRTRGNVMITISER